MAGVGLSVNFDNVALAVGSFKTVAAVKAPTNQMVRLKSFGFSTDGIAGDAVPLEYRLARITAASGTGTATTPIKLNNAMTVTVQTTARKNFTSEPSDSGTAPYLYPGLIHPQGGLSRDVTFDDIFIDGGTELALQVKVPTGGTAVNATGCLLVEE
jgi:hypothetical protein